MNHFFLGDEVSSLIDEVHNGVNVVGPLVQHVVGILTLPEVDETIESVDFRRHSLVNHQL